MTARNPNSDASSIPSETLQKLLILLVSVSVAAVVVATVSWKSLLKSSSSRAKTKAAAANDEESHGLLNNPDLKVQLDSPKKPKKEGGKSIKKTMSSMFRSLSIQPARRIKHVRVCQLGSSPTDRVEEGRLEIDPVEVGLGEQRTSSVAGTCGSSAGSARSEFEVSGGGSAEEPFVFSVEAIDEERKRYNT